LSLLLPDWTQMHQMNYGMPSNQPWGAFLPLKHDFDEVAGLMPSDQLLDVICRHHMDSNVP